MASAATEWKPVKKGKNKPKKTKKVPELRGNQVTLDEAIKIADGWRPKIVTKQGVTHVSGVATTLVEKPDVVAHLGDGWSFAGVWTAQDRKNRVGYDSSPLIFDYKLFRMWGNSDPHSHEEYGDLLVLSRKHGRTNLDPDYEVTTTLHSQEMETFRAQGWHFHAILTVREKAMGIGYPKTEEVCVYAHKTLPSGNIMVFERAK